MNTSSPVNNKIIENGVTDNSYTIIDQNIALEALGDKIIVLEDAFKSGYECPTCGGDGASKGNVCSWCLGKKFDLEGDKCRACGGKGKANCPDCNGSGAKKGGIVIPEDARRRPSTGVVTSVGPDCKNIRVGQRVLYTNFSGIFININQKGVLRIMREHEPMAVMYGVGKLEATIGG